MGGEWGRVFTFDIRFSTFLAPLNESSRTLTNTSLSFAPIDSFAPANSGIRPAHCAALGAASELVVLVFEQDVERCERSVTARNILLQIELVRFAQFVARVHLLLENSQIIPNHDVFVEECLEPATAGKLISAEANCPRTA